MFAFVIDRLRPRLAARALPPARERRAGPRYRPIEGQCWLSWDEGDALRRSPGLLLDIGRGGAAVVADEAPEPGAIARICLRETSFGEWAEARVVAATTTERGPHLVRLAFVGACPWPLLKRALFGLDDFDGPVSWPLPHGFATGD